MNVHKEAFEYIQEEYEINNIYFSDVISYVADKPPKDDDIFDDPESYGKTNEEIAKDAVTLLKFMISTGNFRIRKDVISEEYSHWPETFVTDDDMVLLESFFLKMFNKENGFNLFSLLYEIDRLDDSITFPEEIPDEVVAIFQKVTD